MSPLAGSHVAYRTYRRNIVENGSVTQLPYLEQVQADTFALLEILRRDPSLPVPTCPGWDVVRLAGHVGRVHRMAAQVVQKQLALPPGKDDIESVPQDLHRTDEYLLRGLARLLETLRATPQGLPAWNMTGENLNVGFWSRRMAFETSVHRADAELALGETVTPLSAALAVDGVDEFFALMPARVLHTRQDADLGGTLHLHATDGDGEWMVHVERGSLRVEHCHGKGDAAVRGAASDLLLAVWGRRPISGLHFERFGNAAVVEAFEALGAF